MDACGAAEVGVGEALCARAVGMARERRRAAQSMVVRMCLWEDRPSEEMVFEDLGTRTESRPLRG